MIYGEEEGFTKDLTLCQSEAGANASALPYINAIHCVGNYAEIVDVATNRGMNRLNKGTTGLFYALPFGNLDRLAESENSFRAPYGDGLNNVMETGMLDCGVVVEMHQNDSVDAMNTDLCRALAASLFYGDAADVNITVFHSKDEAFASLGNGTIDVAAGLAVEKGPDFAGYHFSDPYLFVADPADADQKSVSSIAFATRDDDRLLSSYVSTVVMALFWGVEDVVLQKRSSRMPLASTFGKDLRWFMRYTVAYAGNYDELHARHFGPDAERGMNALNDEGTPQLRSFPGLELLGA